jgi:hypothetical protein
MDDFLDHTANVTVSFSIIEVSERRWSFVEPSVRSENRSSTFSGWVKQVSYDGKDCWSGMLLIMVRRLHGESRIDPPAE